MRVYYIENPQTTYVHDTDIEIVHQNENLWVKYNDIEPLIKLAELLKWVSEDWK